MKRRILIGLAPIFVLIIAMGAYAVLLFSNLGNRVDVILRENFRSVLAGQQMKEASERMDSALFFSLIGEESRGRDLYEKNLPLFEEGLKTELGNITLAGEGAMADSIRTLHDEYVRKADVFWRTADLATRRQMYFGEMLPTFTRIKDAAQKVIDMNEANMVEADRAARELSVRSTQYMVLASIIGIAVALFFANRLQASILGPIRTLTAVSQDLGEGKLDQVVPVASTNEFGQLAQAFNKMSAKLRAYRQAMGDQILQARQMTEITFSALPDPIIALSPDGAINFTNPAANALFSKLGSPALSEPVQEQVANVLKGGPDYLPTSFEKTVILRVDDREIFLLPRVVGLRNEAGALYGAAVILQDVTRLRLLDEVKGNLVSTVSHELKTPLTSIRMGLHLLLEERIGGLNPKQTELLLAAREESERLLRMINDLLDLARLESGHLHLDHDGALPADLVRTAIENCGGVAETRGVRLLADVEPNAAHVLADPSQLAHVFANLLSNAVKYSPRGEEITLKAANRGEMVRFSICDHGKGIAPQYQAHIFDRFFRVPGESSRGVGLGLAIAREIVIAHGGRIGVRSDGVHGSEFFFDIPAINPGASA